MNYLVFLYQNQLYQGQMETPGSFTIGSGKKDSLIIEGMKNAQITIKENKKGILSVTAKEPIKFFDDNVNRDTMTTILLDAENMTALYVYTQKETAKESLKIPYNAVIHVGRSTKNDITIKHPYISGKHFTIYSDAGIIRVEDHDSTNGLYLNGKKITKAKLHSGDVLSVIYLNFRLVNNELFFENVGDALTLRPIREETALGGNAHPTECGELKYHRSPRTQKKMPTEDIFLASAPAAPSKFEKRRGMFSSLIGTGTMFVANMATSAMSPALLAARAASLVSPITSVAMQSSNDKHAKGKIAQYEQLRMEKYGQYIEEQKARIEEVANEQREILTQENPSAIECIENVRQLKRSLWERGPADRDFLDVRLGMGYEKLCVQVKSREENGFRMDNDELRQLAEQIVEETRIVDHVPARLSLRDYQTISVIGDRQKMMSLVRNMIVSLTTAHCFEDVRIVGIFDKKEQSHWEALRWLPHIWDENRQFRYLAFEPDKVSQLCEIFQELLKNRMKQKDDCFGKETPKLPHYVFLIGSREYMEREDIMQLLTSNHPGLGVTSVFLFDNLYSMPHSCQFIVDVDNGPCGYVRNEVNNKFYFTMDENVNDTMFDTYARRMAAIELEGFAVAAEIPQGISFLKGFHVSNVEQLDAPKRWSKSQPYKSLGAPIGVMGGEKVFSLDIHEKAHGPHGLVAGTTGSGKSELLQTWILSMALCYHPHDVAFVLIDYKGGGMANLLIDLPHVVGKITNIGSNIGRSLISLQSEMKRRQRVFDQYKEYQVNHIDKYQKLYKDGIAKEPLPHLIIVADEFAELRANEPDFMAGLISASRIGRSLGVHLVLATQKPSGVVDDQIQSNSKFRLCLKVQNASDSREMIHRPDAARITQPGRAYVLVGEDEIFELFQSYWSGAPYNPSAAQNASEGNSICLVGMSGEKTRFKKQDKPKEQLAQIDELTAIRQYLCQTAQKLGIHRLPGPWLSDLPETLALDDLHIPSGFYNNEWRGELPWLNIPIGMYDAPEVQAQGTQYINLAMEGHYAIYGAPGSGKTTLLKTIVWSVGRYYTPADVHIYIMDCGGWGMNVFQQMPHVGGVALDCEEEKFVKLQQMLTEEMALRKKKFLQVGVGSLSAYREAGGSMAAIILAVDNIIGAFEQFPDLENLFITIAREGATYGIYLIYTANSTTGVRYKVLQNIRGAVALALTDSGDYASIVGRLEGRKLPNVRGRAFFKGASPVEIQVALPLWAETQQEISEQIKKISQQMDRAWTGERPAVIPIMPDTVSFEDIWKNYKVRTQIPTGMDTESIRPAMLGLEQQYNMLITGSMNVGKSKMLLEMAKALSEKRPDDKLFIFDTAKAALGSLASNVHAYTSNKDGAKVTAMLSEIVGMLNIRKRAQNQARALNPDGFSEEAFIETYEQICIFIDDLKDFVDEVDNNAKNAMERICRMAQGLGVLVFVAGRVADIERYNEIESLTRAIVSNQKGIAIGGKPSSYSFMANDLNYKEKEMEAGERHGFLYDSGHCGKIRLPDE